MAEKKPQYEKALGRRKTAVARVRISLGKGDVVINGKPLKEYFTSDLLQNVLLEPFVEIGKEGSFDVSAKVLGGGPKGQAVAIRHGISRALVKYDEAFKALLKVEGFLTRDPRAKERKKFGRRRARRAHQWRKR